MKMNEATGLRIDGIVLKESQFRREAHVPEDIKLKIEFDYAQQCSDSILVYELTCRVTGGKALSMSTTFVGIFSSHGEASMSLDKYADVNAPATMMPYIREEIHSRFLKANLLHLGILPPINVKATFNPETKAKQSKKQSKKRTQKKPLDSKAKD